MDPISLTNFHDKMSNAHLAFYKGPAKDLVHKITHYGTCAWTFSKYSHVELVIDGVCYSSSARDGGVRKKVISNLNTSGHWDIFEVQINKDYALNVFAQEEGKGYDWRGAAKFVMPWLPESEMQWYCSELIATMMGSESNNQSPQDLFEDLVITKYAYHD